MPRTHMIKYIIITQCTLNRINMILSDFLEGGEVVPFILFEGWTYNDIMYYYVYYNYVYVMTVCIGVSRSTNKFKI